MNIFKIVRFMTLPREMCEWKQKNVPSNVQRRGRASKEKRVLMSQSFLTADLNGGIATPARERQ